MKVEVASWAPVPDKPTVSEDVKHHSTRTATSTFTQLLSAQSIGCSSRYLKVSVCGLPVIVQELCESRGGRPGLSVLTSLLVSVDVKNY